MIVSIPSPPAVSDPLLGRKMSLPIPVVVIWIASPGRDDVGRLAPE